MMHCQCKEQRWRVPGIAEILQMLLHACGLGTSRWQRIGMWRMICASIGQRHAEQFRSVNEWVQQQSTVNNGEDEEAPVP